MKVKFSSMQDLQLAVQNRDPKVREPQGITKVQIGRHKYDVSVGANGSRSVAPTPGLLGIRWGNEREAGEIQRILFSPVVTASVEQPPLPAGEVEPSAPPYEEPEPSAPPYEESEPSAPPYEKSEPPPPPYEESEPPPPPYAPPVEQPSAYEEGGGAIGGAAGGDPPDRRSPTRPMPAIIPPASPSPPPPPAPALTPVIPVGPAISEQTQALIAEIREGLGYLEMSIPVHGQERTIQTHAYTFLNGDTIDTGNRGLDVATAFHSLLTPTVRHHPDFQLGLAIVQDTVRAEGQLTEPVATINFNYIPGSSDLVTIRHAYLVLQNRRTREQVIIDPSASLYMHRDNLCMESSTELLAEIKQVFSGGQASTRYMMNTSVFGEHNRDDTFVINRAIYNKQEVERAARLLFQAWYGVNMLPL